MLINQNLSLAVRSLRSHLKKPLRPFWVTPDSTFTNERTPSPHPSDYHTIICCTASRRVLGAEMTEDGYIQGAGDDSEGWSNGITPALFWRHSGQLLAAVEEDIPGLIPGLTNMDQDRDTGVGNFTKIGPTSLFIGTSPSAAQAGQYNGVVICGGSAPFKPNDENKHDGEKRTLHLQCGDGKLGSRALRTQLPLIPPFIASLPSSSSPPDLLFVCPTGKDLAIGIALAVLCLFFDDNCKQLVAGPPLFYHTHLVSLIS